MLRGNAGKQKGLFHFWHCCTQRWCLHVGDTATPHLIALQAMMPELRASIEKGIRWAASRLGTALKAYGAAKGSSTRRKIT